MNNKLFFELLQVALSRRDNLSVIPSDEQWESLYDECKKQTLLGIGYCAIDHLAQQGIRPHRRLLAKWYLSVQEQEAMNHQVNAAAVELTRQSCERGMRVCVLKGQGLSTLYPNPLRRTPGDIDAWYEGSPHKVINYLKNNNVVLGKRCYHHVDASHFQDVELEAHYRPSFRVCFMTNARMQKWFIAERSRQMQNLVQLPDGSGCICVPTLDFNLVYEMAHVANHIMHEGIGLRQLIDYFYTLQKWNEMSPSVDDNKKVCKLLSSFGMLHTASAIMYVLKHVFDVPAEWMYCEPDSRYGSFLLSEILRGGNFGKSDDRISANERYGTRKALKRLQRDFRYFRYEPLECMWEPVFRLWHWGCRKVYDRY